MRIRRPQQGLYADKVKFCLESICNANIQELGIKSTRYLIEFLDVRSYVHEGQQIMPLYDQNDYTIGDSEGHFSSWYIKSDIQYLSNGYFTTKQSHQIAEANSIVVLLVPLSPNSTQLSDELMNTNRADKEAFWICMEDKS